MNQVEVFNEMNEEIESFEKISEIVHVTLKKENVTSGIINIILVDQDMIQQINRDYRKIDRVTDVISFAFEDTKDEVTFDFRLLGDIYICIPQAKLQAENYGHSFERELLFLTVHGVLHLLGYDHMESEDEKKMFGRQEMILNEYGITR